jgi:hypothetical protein
MTKEGSLSSTRICQIQGKRPYGCLTVVIGIQHMVIMHPSLHERYDLNDQTMLAQLTQLGLQNNLSPTSARQE